MKKVITFVLSLTVFTAMAQDKKTTSVKVKNPKTITTASGLEYTITEKGNGKTATEMFYANYATPVDDTG